VASASNVLIFLQIWALFCFYIVYRVSGKKRILLKIHSKGALFFKGEVYLNKNKTGLNKLSINSLVVQYSACLNMFL